MIRRSLVYSPIVALGLFINGQTLAQDSFYKGKTIRIIVGGSAGGGYDTYTRVISRHMGKHIPGNPAFVVDNMPGAGSIIAANHVYKVSRPDGLTMCHPVGGILLQNVLGKAGIEFDSRKFLYVGAPAQDTLSAGDRFQVKK